MKIVIASCFVLLLSVVCAKTTVPLSTGARTFGGSVSQGHITTSEQTLYTTSNADGGVMTYFWYTADYAGIENTIFTYYIDENTSSGYKIEYSYYIGHGIGFGDQTAPWGTSKVGKGAKTGAVYNNYKVPFSKSIRITVRSPTPAQGVLWFVTRGVYGALPIVLGDYTLPSTAKLYLFKNVNITMNPLDFITLFDTFNAGALYQVTLAVQSGNLNFLEGCFRAYTYNQGGGSTFWLASSGTEDYFQSAFYFDGNAYKFDGAGLTHPQQMDQWKGQLSAYKFHDEDPIFFSDGMKFVWRNGDSYSRSTGLKCTDDNGIINGNPQKSVVTTYSWVYLW